MTRINDFNDYILDKIFENSIGDLPLKFSEKFRSIIAQINHRIAFDLYNSQSKLNSVTFIDITEFNNKVIDAYIGYEAAYYKLDPKEYREKFFKLRSGGFSSVDTFFGGSVAAPIGSVFEQFWKSFEDHSEFNPRESHNPTAEWNRMREIR